jgi:hypothetical protein
VWTTIGARLDTYTSGTIPAASANSNQLIWVSDIQQVQVSNGTSWVQVGSASGLKNYFAQNNANPNFETNSVTPWSACTLTFSSGVPSGVPTLTATQMAIATTAASPLAGTYSLQLTKSAANAQYQGFISGAMTIDREDTAKVLYGSFSYEVVSGTVDFSGASTQTYEIWIYNTLSGAWTQPAGYRGMNQSSGQGKVTFSFQTDGSVSNNSYKIAVITQQTGTGAIVVKFDSFQIGPSAIVLGATMTDWQAYTPAFNGFGTPTPITMFWRRVGDSVEIKGKFTCGTSTGVQAQVGLPNSFTTDSNKISTIEIVGVAEIGLIGAIGQNVGVTYAALSEQNVQYITFSSRSSSTTGLTKLTGSSVATSGIVISVYAKVPVSGFSSNVQMSNDTDTRVVVARVSGNPANATAGNPIIYPTVTQDTHGAYNATTGKYTIPVSGYYDVSAFISCTFATNGYTYVALDGVQQTPYLQYIPSAVGAGGGSITIYANAGQLLDIRATQNCTAFSGTTANGFSVSRRSGPSVIAANESVNASYYVSATFAASTTTPVNFDSKEFDSHNAVTTSATAWKFTAPVSGLYSVTLIANIGTGSFGWHSIYKNGVVYKGIATGSSTTNAFGNGLVRLNAGDYVDIRPQLATSYTGGALSAALITFFQISRVGN